jgi:hypothetical protein
MNFDKRKILLALQYWDGDKANAMQVARLIADLEPRLCERADFLFVSRFDCQHDQSSVEYCSRKFKMRTHISRRRATGWPWGCNELWFETMQYVYEHTVADRREPLYKAVLTFEADAFPLCPNWISILSDSWDDCRPANIVGSLLQHPGPHVNGNALFSCDLNFSHWVSRQLCGCAPSGGWDYILAPRFKEWGWKNSPLMRSWWQTPTLEAERFEALLGQQVCFLHGVKDLSTIQHVRKKYLLTPA